MKMFNLFLELFMVIFILIINLFKLGIFLILDFALYKPYYHKKICIYYGFYCFIFEYTLIILIIIDYT